MVDRPWIPFLLLGVLLYGCAETELTLQRSTDEIDSGNEEPIDGGVGGEADGGGDGAAVPDGAEMDGSSQDEGPNENSDGGTIARPDNDGGEDAGDAGSDTGAFCTCHTVDDCCDGCEPINDAGACSDDALDCTDDVCRDGTCEHDLQFGFCLIEGACFADRKENPDNGCQQCDVTYSDVSWRNKPKDSECNDGLFCNGDDTCDDDGSCANHTGDPCGAGDVCNNQCDESDDNCFSPEDTPCDDDLFCNGDDACDGAGNCEHSGDPCAAGDECNQCNDDDDNCLSPDTVECDDQDSMTYDDFCDGSGGCLGTAYCDVYSCWSIVPTNQEFCYDTEGIQLETCPGTVGEPSCASTDCCGQDAHYPDNDREFADYDAGSDTVVTDSLTGLEWQKAYVEEVPGMAWDVAMNHCHDSEYAGHTDWRLPDYHELIDLVDYGRRAPASSFPGMPSYRFWTSSMNVNSAGRAWFVIMEEGGAESGEMTEPLAVKCVRGSSRETASTRFHVSGEPGEETVLDRATGLIWSKSYVDDTPGLTWKDALAYCEESDHAGYTDWRVPNVNELRSLVDVDQPAGQVVSDFPDMPSLGFWSSTTVYPPNSSGALVVAITALSGYDANVAFIGKTWEFPVRCVRGGP